LFVGTSTTPVELDLSGRWGLFVQASKWLAANAVPGGSYTIVLEKNENVYSQEFPKGASLTLTTLPSAGVVTLSMDSSGGMLFNMLDGAELVLDGSVVLQGKAGNITPLIQINNKCSVVARGNSRITGNTAQTFGAGVYVATGGSISLSGNASIDGNGASVASKVLGGGIYATNGTVSLAGNSRVSGNRASIGGGIFMVRGELTIADNASVDKNTAFSQGGGISVTFPIKITMTGGTINGVDAGVNTNSCSLTKGGHAVHWIDEKRKEYYYGQTVTAGNLPW
jgi:predicted outer membrane repeat protein